MKILNKLFDKVNDNNSNIELAESLFSTLGVGGDIPDKYIREI